MRRSCGCATNNRAPELGCTKQNTLTHDASGGRKGGDSCLQGKAGDPPEQSKVREVVGARGEGRVWVREEGAATVLGEEQAAVPVHYLGHHLDRWVLVMSLDDGGHSGGHGEQSGARTDW